MMAIIKIAAILSEHTENEIFILLTNQKLFEGIPRCNCIYII
jgi:hypothetical protein